LKEHPDLSKVIDLAEKEPVLLVAPNGHQFIKNQAEYLALQGGVIHLAEADDFDAEVGALRNSRRFQQFLDERMGSESRIPIEEIEKEIRKGQ